LRILTGRGFVVLRILTGGRFIALRILTRRGFVVLRILTGGRFVALRILTRRGFVVLRTLARGRFIALRVLTLVVDRLRAGLGERADGLRAGRLECMTTAQRSSLHSGAFVAVLRRWILADNRR